MNILIKSAKIINKESKYHNKNMDILIKNGTIENIAKSIKSCPKLIDKGKQIVYKADNLHVSAGWFDLHANFGEPGYEDQETLSTGINAATKGGFTGVMVMPNNKPCIDNKSMFNFIKNTVKNSIVDVIPAGNITQKGEGNQIVEMHEMHKAGCIAFTDDKKSINRNEVMKIAMLYSKDTESIIMNFPCDKSIANNGFMNEGKTSTLLGIKGIPCLAEEIMVDRDLSLCEYTNCRLHISYISTKNSVNKIKRAKAKGIKVSADVALYNLFLTDTEVNNFDTRYKVMPPLRTIKDNKALIKGLKEGTIDVISTDHTPITNELKKIEFDNAANGIIGLESAFGLLSKHIIPQIGLDTLIDKISTNPRKILKMKEVIIQEGEQANFTLFNPDLEWVFNASDIESKSCNTPFIGQKLKGKALAILNNGKFKEC